jgi:hypothetical protein
VSRSKKKRLGNAPKRRPRDLREALRAAGDEPNFSNAFTVEQAAQVARDRVAWQARRSDIAETQRRRSRISDPQLSQERHSPTVEIAVDDPEAKRKARRNITRVRQSEAWRHNQLNAMQRQAETEMLTAFTQRTAGLGAHGMSMIASVYGRAAEVRETEWMARLDETWRDWQLEARRQRVKVVTVIMILSEPRTLVEVEQSCGLDRGQAMAIYVRALDLWATLRGWLRPQRIVDKSPRHGTSS